MSESLKGKHVLLTGGAGFIGSHLATAIGRLAPASLLIVDDLFLGREENLSEARAAFPTLQFEKADASNLEIMRRLVSDRTFDVCFNLAVIPLPTSLERPKWSVDVNHGIAVTACELLREGRIKTLVHFSSSEVYGTALQIPMDETHPLMPHTPYAASKAAGDHIALSYGHTFGLDVRIARPFNNFGPRQNSRAYAGIIPIVLKQLARGLPIEIHGDGEQTRDFIFAADTARAAIAMYETPSTRGCVVNVASGIETSVNTLVKLLAEASGRTPDIRHVAPRPGDVRRHLGGVSLCSELLNFRPSTSLAEGLEKTVRWYENEFRRGATG